MRIRATHENRGRSRSRWFAVVAIVGAFALGSPVLTGCGDDEVVEQQRPKSDKGGNERATPSQAAQQAQAGPAPAQPQAVQLAGGLWQPRTGERVALQGRDPFYGFVDEMIAERLRAEEELRQQEQLEEEPLKPAQRFDVLEFQLVAVITNTAQPKALLIDPLGQAHRLRTGDLIGKKNGVIVDIRRNEIEILQGDNLLEGERVVMKLHPDPPAGVRVEVQ